MTIASERKADCLGIKRNIVRIQEILSQSQKYCQLSERVVPVESSMLNEEGATAPGRKVHMYAHISPPNYPLPSIWKRWLVCKDTVSGEITGV